MPEFRLVSESLNADPNLAIGARLREERESKKLTQPELANLAGVGHSQVTKIERGIINPTIKTLLKLSRAMGISVHKLIPDDL